MNCERKIPGTPRPPSIRISLLTPIENYGFKKRGEGKEKEKKRQVRFECAECINRWHRCPSRIARGAVLQ